MGMGALEVKTAMRLRALLGHLSNLLTEDERATISQLIDVGEPTVALECMCGAVQERRGRMSARLLQEVNELGRGLGADESFWAQIDEDPGVR